MSRAAHLLVEVVVVARQRDHRVHIPLHEPPPQPQRISRDLAPFQSRGARAGSSKNENENEDDNENNNKSTNKNNNDNYNNDNDNDNHGNGRAVVEHGRVLRWRPRGRQRQADGQT